MTVIVRLFEWNIKAIRTIHNLYVYREGVYALYEPTNFTRKGRQEVWAGIIEVSRLAWFIGLGCWTCLAGWSYY